MAKKIEIDLKNGVSPDIRLDVNIEHNPFVVMLISFDEATRLRDLLSDALKQNSETDHRITGVGC